MKKINGVSWVLQPNHVHDHAYYTAGFSWEECDEILKIAKQETLSDAAILGDPKKFKDIDSIRKSKVHFMHPNEETSWIYRKLTGIVLSLNQDFFRFNLYNFGEAIQFTEYQAPGNHYSWHTDMAVDHTPRKLSIVVQLTDPDDYVGGDFELWTGATPTKLNRDRGTVLAFPSYHLHRVTPVTEGTRNSLVAWVGGPPFK